MDDELRNAFTVSGFKNRCLPMYTHPKEDVYDVLEKKKAKACLWHEFCDKPEGKNESDYSSLACIRVT